MEMKNISAKANAWITYSVTTFFFLMFLLLKCSFLSWLLFRSRPCNELGSQPTSFQFWQQVSEIQSNHRCNAPQMLRWRTRLMRRSAVHSCCGRWSVSADEAGIDLSAVLLQSMIRRRNSSSGTSSKSWHLSSALRLDLFTFEHRKLLFLEFSFEHLFRSVCSAV